MIEIAQKSLKAICLNNAIPSDEMNLVTVTAAATLKDRSLLMNTITGMVEVQLNIYFELLLFLPPFIGWPSVVQGLNSLVKKNSSVPRMVSDEVSTQKGIEIFRIVHGGNSATIEHMMKTVSTRLYDTVINEVYAKHYPLCALTARQKELIAITALALSDRQQQLKTHIISAINAGMSPKEIEDIFMVLSWFGGWPLAINAIKALSQVMSLMETKTL